MATKGQAGEDAARYHFSEMGWTMFRTQPPTKYVYQGGKVRIIQDKSSTEKGIADFTGYDHTGMYRACEVKEHSGDTMPCSVIRKDQRDWLDKLPAGSAYIGILWTSHNEFRIHRFKFSGSYKYISYIKLI